MFPILKGMINIHSKKIFTPVLTVVLGLIGAFLRKIELNTVFEASGLAKQGQPITIILAVFSALAAVYFIFSSIGLKRLSAEESYNEAFGGGGLVPFGLSALATAGIAVGSVLYFLNGGETTLAALLMLAGLVTAVAVVALAYGTMKKRGEPKIAAVFSTLIVIFICFWMVLEYKFRSADPVLLDYVYDFLALCALTLAFYYKAGFAFARPKPAHTMMLSKIAVYFSIVSMPGASGKAQLLFFICLAIVLLADKPAFASNLKVKIEEKIEE